MAARRPRQPKHCVVIDHPDVDVSMGKRCFRRLDKAEKRLIWTRDSLQALGLGAWKPRVKLVQE